MNPIRPEDWLKATPCGLYCLPGDFYIDPMRQATGRSAVPGLLDRWLHASDADARFALLRPTTGGIHVGVSARLAKAGLGRFGRAEATETEELWHGLEPPYRELFAWLDGRADRPRIDGRDTFRPVMLATAMDAGKDFPDLDPADFAAE